MLNRTVVSGSLDACESARNVVSIKPFNEDVASLIVNALSAGHSRIETLVSSLYRMIVFLFLVPLLLLSAMVKEVFAHQ